MERLEPNREQVIFNSMSGPLPVIKTSAGYVMDFPARHSVAVAPPPDLLAALGANPSEAVADAFNYLVLFESAEVIRKLSPNLGLIATLDRSGVIVTAMGDQSYDFTSRYFAPAKGIPEDPVTGGAHCALAPYWAQRLGKTEFHAYQASKRGGEVRCRLRGDRVELEGTCVFYMEGKVEI
jgi:predicted PhzF superfamily epimerase YddE/YHI9